MFRLTDACSQTLSFTKKGREQARQRDEKVLRLLATEKYQPVSRRDHISVVAHDGEYPSDDSDLDEVDPEEELGLDDPLIFGSRKAIFLIVLAAAETLLMSGVIFGWPAVQSVMIAQGQYSELCGAVGNALCPARSLKFTSIFIAASSAFALVFWPSGYVLDRFGPRVSNVLGCALLLLGTLLFAFSDSKGSFDAFLPGFVIMGAAGPNVFLSFLSLSNLFPDRKATVISLFNVMLDASALIFVLLQMIYQAAPSASLRALFLIFAAFPLLSLLAAYWLLPRVSYPSPPGHEGFAEGGGGTNTNPFGPELARSRLGLQVRSKAFIFGALFTAFQLLRVNFYIGTVNSQLAHLSPESGDAWTLAFTFVLPAGGVLSIPIVGWFMDKCSLTVAMMALSVAATAFGVFNAIPVLGVQAVTFVLMAFFRAFLFGGMSSYIVIVFGFDNFGQLWGLITSSSGLLNFASVAIEWATLHSLAGNFFWPNAGMAAVSAVLIAFPIWIRRVAKEAAEIRLRRENDHELLLETELREFSDISHQRESKAILGSTDV